MSEQLFLFMFTHKNIFYGANKIRLKDVFFRKHEKNKMFRHEDYFKHGLANMFP